MQKFATLLAFASTLALGLAVGPDDIYQESGGLVIMEAENTPSSLGTGTDRWDLYTPASVNFVAGATNNAHLEFRGNGVNGGDPKRPLTYKFKINQGGYYYLHIRARARLDGQPDDKNNDCYVKMGGDSFGAGPNQTNAHNGDASLSLLTNNTKMYGAAPDTWGWSNMLDAGGNTNKRYPVYNFNAGSTYVLTISGRSINYNIDRIVIRHANVLDLDAKSPLLPESGINELSGQPISNAGSDRSIALPTDSATLFGSGNDSDGSIISYAWSQVSGPSTATLSGATTTNLTASTLVQGSYVFRLTVTDNSGKTATDDATVTVTAASSGSGQSVAALTLINADTEAIIGPMTNGMTIDLATLPNFSVRADTSPAAVGSVQFGFDGNPNIRTESSAPYTINGDVGGVDYLPWPVTLGNHTLSGTPFTASAGGGTAGTALVINFTVINSALTGDPVANAGSDKSIVLPQSSVTLNGSGTDGEGTITSYLWTRVSGPNTPAMTGAGTANLGVSGLIEGTYVFRLTVTDNEGHSASDEATVSVISAGSGSAGISGELKKWHKITLGFTGPATSETATPNPFTDYRLNVTFTHLTTGKSYVVPGYYAADGNAANTSATSGNVWRVHFAPDETGTWTYAASFRTGTNIAANSSPTAGTSAGFFDGDSGNFNVSPTDKTGRDFRRKGRLQYVGKHHLRFAETGEYFMKAGTDAPENLLAYQDFDGDFKTDGQKDDLIKSWQPHVADWQAGDPVWQGSKGKGLIGAVNYLASEGLNAFSFLTMNINGDDRNVFPYTSYGERSRLDVSKLDQWEIVFEHGTRKGMYLHFKTQEIENQGLLDGGDLGNQRKLYYRELVARFGHHLGLNWNLGEENTSDLSRKQAWAQYFHDTDPYHHHIVIHNGSNHYNMMGSASKLTGFSLQLNASDFTDMFAMTKDYIDRSEDADKPWVVACDEPGDSRLSLRPDSDPGNSHVDARKNAMWGNIMAGGAGCEFYFGYDKPHSDLTCNDFRSRNAFWDYCRHALQFLDDNDVPFELMKNQNSLVSGNGSNANRCLARTGDTYLVQLHSGGSHTLNLAGASGSFSVKWLNPRTGSIHSAGNVTGGGTVSLGNPPDTSTQDWVVLVKSSSGGGGTNSAPVVSAGADKSAFLTAASVAVNLTGSVTDDGLPDGLALSRTWSRVSGPAAVAFSSTSTTSTTATFTAAGTYTLRLSASDTQFTTSDDVVVTISLPANGTQLSFEPVHDTYLQNGTNNNITQLRVEKSSTRTRTSYLQFDLSSLAIVPTSATLRLTEGDDISSGSMTFRLYAATSNNWTESGISSTTAPTKGALLATFSGNVTDNLKLDFNVISHVTGPGIYSFILETDSSSLDVSFASYENSDISARPVLLVSTPSNSSPLFSGYSLTTMVNQPKFISFASILSYASDADGDPLSVLVEDLSSSQGGSITTSNQGLTYTPPIDQQLQDSVFIKITDGRGGEIAGQIALQVINDDGITGRPAPVMDRPSGNQPRIQFNGDPNRTYYIQRTVNMTQWTTVREVLAPHSGPIEWTDPSPPSGKAFYRLTSP